MDQFLFGADYYPEHWDEADWEKHATMMEEAHFNVVRLAEFAWAKLEPSEGNFDFSWLDRAIDTLAKHNIGVILGTPTPTPPVWLLNKHDILMRDRYFRPRYEGSRRECCSNNKDYQRYSDIIVTEMAKHYKNHKNVVGWQIDNEFGCHATTRCYCDSCKKEFQNWLQKKYESIEEVNRRFGTAFWSLTYKSFDDVILPAYNSCEGESSFNYAHNPTLEQEYRRFSSDSWVNYQQRQIDIIRKYSDAPITHNFMGAFSDIDYYDLAKPLDFVSWDNYPEDQWAKKPLRRVGSFHELMYGVKQQNFIVMEEQSGPCGWDIMNETPRPGQIRLWAHQAMAHGSNGIVFFRFMACRFGMEQYWYGILDHDGVKRRRYFEVQSLGEEVQKIAPLLMDSKPVAPVHVYRSYDNIWMNEIKHHARNFNIYDIYESFYMESEALGVTTTYGERDFADAKIVILPAQEYVSDSFKQRLEAFVDAGGVLILTYRTGLRDVDNNMLPETIPGNLRKLAGLTLEEFDAIDHEVKIAGEVNGSAHTWCDVVKCETAKAVSLYDGEYYKNTPAITVNSYGKGKVYYLAAMPDSETLRKFLSYVYAKESLPICNDLPENVEVITRRKGNETFTYLMNGNGEDVTLRSFKGKNSKLTNKEFDGVLPAYGVEIV